MEQTVHTTDLQYAIQPPSAIPWDHPYPFYLAEVKGACENDVGGRDGVKDFGSGGILKKSGGASCENGGSGGLEKNASGGFNSVNAVEIDKGSGGCGKGSDDGGDGDEDGNGGGGGGGFEGVECSSNLVTNFGPGVGEFVSNLKANDMELPTTLHQLCTNMNNNNNKRYNTKGAMKFNAALNGNKSYFRNNDNLNGNNFNNENNNNTAGFKLVTNICEFSLQQVFYPNTPTRFKSNNMKIF